jgi:hypothetical protein
MLGGGLARLSEGRSDAMCMVDYYVRALVCMARCLRGAAARGGGARQGRAGQGRAGQRNGRR